VELIVSGGTVIHVESGHRVDSYFDIPMLRSMKGWWKKCFFYKNNLARITASTHVTPTFYKDKFFLCK
jgi:hypothetical protein